ncbi:MAG: DUF2267 domain-containing protein [Candidatus Aenigmarchaeota archaeon]|nr:DUF2267 domain-containing protein [Candidatus Aenigmarchaeota archaeon]
MAMTGLESFDRTLQKTNEWLRELMDDLHMENRNEAYHVLRSVLQALRDRLPRDEAVQFGAQLPMLVRGFYYEGWDPFKDPAEIRSGEEFFARIREYFHFQRGTSPVNPERYAKAVFSLLSRKMDAGEIEDIRDNFPDDIKGLWGLETALRIDDAAQKKAAEYVIQKSEAGTGKGKRKGRTGKK